MCKMIDPVNFSVRHVTSPLNFRFVFFRSAVSTRSLLDIYIYDSADSLNNPCTPLLNPSDLIKVMKTRAKDR